MSAEFQNGFDYTQEHLALTPKQIREDTDAQNTKAVQIATDLGIEDVYEAAAAPMAQEAKDTVREKKGAREGLSKEVSSEVGRSLEINFGEVEVKESALVGTTQAENLLLSKQFLSQFGESEQLQVQELFNQSGKVKFKLKKFFQNNGYPINEQTYTSFRSSFNDYFTDVEQQIDIDISKNKTRLINVYSSISPNVKEKLAGLQAIPLFEQLPDSYEKLQTLLSADGNLELEQILAAVKESDSENYAELRDVFSSMDPSIASRIDAWESQNNDTPSPLPGTPPDTSIPPEYRLDSIDGNTQTYKDHNGDSIILDAKSGERRLQVEGGEYALATDMPIANFNGPIVKFEKKRQEIQPKIDSVSKLISVMKTIGNSTILKVDDAKKTLISLMPYSLQRSKDPDLVDAIQSVDSMMDLQNLATSGVIAQFKKKLEDDLEKAKEEYQEDIDAQRENYQDMMAENDKGSKKILALINDSGFGSIPQHKTNQLIAEMQSSQLIPELGVPFDLKNIDLPNGDFGEPQTLEGSNDKFVGNLVKFMNKMIGLKPDGTDENGNLVGLDEDAYLKGHAPRTPQEINDLIMKSGIVSGTSIDLDIARKNLTRPLSELEKDDPESIVEEDFDESLTS